MSPFSDSCTPSEAFLLLPFLNITRHWSHGRQAFGSRSGRAWPVPCIAARGDTALAASALQRAETPLLSIGHRLFFKDKEALASSSTRTYGICLSDAVSYVFIMKRVFLLFSLCANYVAEGWYGPSTSMPASWQRRRL